MNSYIKHNLEYEINDVTLDHTFETIKKYDEINMFEKQGFISALQNFEHRNLHVDIGSGTGWLIGKTAPIFKKVIGIEPSVTATNASNKVFSDFKNIEYINEDMVDAIKKIEFISPAFFTSSIVFSHIKDYHVSNFLKELNSAPKNSTLYFFENYDTNIHHPFWYIRNKEWWAKRLPNWQLSFIGISNEEYKSGIFGVCVGKENITNTYTLSAKENVKWHISGILNLIKKVAYRLKWSNNKKI